MKKQPTLSPARLTGGIIAILLALAAALSLLWVADFAPKPVDLEPGFETKILAREAALPLKPGVNKAFRWVHEDKSSTPTSLVFLHGFSATRKEIAPLPELLAERMGMNLFMTRLTGHGMDSEAMGRLTAEELLRDAEEAMAIGRRMGSRVVLLGVSTGASLALALAQRYPEKIAALVLLSPNFRPRRAASLLLKGPLGGIIAREVVREHSWTPTSAAEEAAWTTRYPAVAIHEMMNLLSWVNSFDLSATRVPLLMMYSDVDTVVSVERMKRKFAAYGGPKELFEVTGAHHVLAGDLKSPETTAPVLEKIESFLRLHPPGTDEGP